MIFRLFIRLCQLGISRDLHPFKSVRIDEPGLHQTHPDIPGTQLIPQSLGRTFEGKL